MKRSTFHNSKLQRERLSHGWKQETVAAKLGVDVRTVRRWESGHPVRPLNIAGLTRLFGKSAEELGLVVETYSNSPDMIAQLSPEDPHYLQPSSGLTEQLLSGDLTASFIPLPIQSTPLIGREHDVESVVQLLLSEEVRLLTLTGSGGTGKTRLGVQVAVELRDIFGDGVFFVNLAPIGDPLLVTAAIAQSLGIWEAGGQPLQESLKVYLQEKQLLLLLDNFEQVVGAAGQIADLLTACPRLKLLVTSREVLHVWLEHEFVVPPLALPDRSFSSDKTKLTILSRNPAVELFIQRAQAIRPDFQITTANSAAVVEICIRLDGLPLAIELAAARIKLLSPQALLAWLDRRLEVLTTGARDAPARQKTLRNTIAWSYDLLSPEEQRIFRRLSAFVGGFTLESAVAVCTILGESAITVLDGVDSLIDKSMLLGLGQVGGEEQRFMMLETIREYGLEALALNGEMKDTRQAHALTYLALAEEAEPKLVGPEQAMWLEQLEREYENLRAALLWLLDQGEAGQGMEMPLRLSGALEQFWDVRGHRSEGRKFLERGLAARAGVSAPVLSKALDAATVMAINLSNLDQAVTFCEENLELCREHNDTRGTALSLQRLGWIAWARGKLVEACSMEEKALVLFRELDDKWGIAASLEMLASAALDQAEYATAQVHLEECLALWREIGNEWGRAYSLWLLACAIFYSQGPQPRVSPMLEESLALARKLGHKASVSYTLVTMGFVSFFEGDIGKARSLFQESLAHSREMGDWRSIAGGLYSLGWVAFIENNYALARSLFEESLAILRRLDHKWIIALCLEGLAAAIAAQEQLVGAAQLWGAVSALREAIAAPVPPVIRILCEQLMDAARAQLGEEAFAAALAQGRTMTVEQALAAQKPAMGLSN
jgi:predicted ATPase/transcriptional regulator with XRE-family HTH domain